MASSQGVNANAATMAGVAGGAAMSGLASFGQGIHPVIDEYMGKMGVAETEVGGSDKISGSSIKKYH